MSIKRKLVVIIMLVSCSAVLLSSSVFVVYQWFAFRQRMVHDLSMQAEMVADNCTASLSFENADDALQVLNSLQVKRSISLARVYRLDKTVLSEYRRADVVEDTAPPDFNSFGYHFDRGNLELFRKVLLKGQHLGFVYLRSDLSELSAFLNHSLIGLAFMMVFIFAVAYFLSSKLQGVVSGPIFHLAATARAVSQNQDYSMRAHRYTHDETGQLTEAFNSMLHQIEERDSALRDLRNLLHNIINSMPSVLVGVDRDGCVTQWNREAENFTGITAEDAHGRTLEDVFPRMTAEMERVKLAIKERQPQKNSKIPTIKDGAPRFSDVTVYPLIANGVDGAVIRIDDVTDQVRIEEMMIQSEKMLSVGGLAAGMAHEINNPLAGILQNVQVMRNRLTDGLPKNKAIARECGTSMAAIGDYMEKRGILTMIEAVMESGRRAAQIVENMLSFSRKSDTKFTPCNLAQLLDKTLELASNDYDLKKKYDFRRIEIQRDYDPNMTEVWCEQTKIQQVILNLLKNGAEAMTDKTKLKVNPSGDAAGHQPHFILRLKSDDGMARMEIEDNGTGMDEATRKRIFEPFFTTKDVGLGTGLGLSVSYFIITENHGGTMSVESAPGKGCKFIIRLPMKKDSHE